MNVQHYKNALDKLKADDATRQKILDIPQRRKKARPKLRQLMHPAAAVLVLMFGTVVYAAQSGLFSVIYDREADYSNFEDLTGEMDISSLECESDGLTVTPMGYAADSYSIFCVFKLDFDHDIPMYDYYEEQYIDGWGHDGVEMENTYARFSTNGGHSDIRFVREDSRTFYCIFTVNCTGEMSGTIPIDFTCFNMSGVYLNSGRIISYDNIIDSSLFSADFTVEIPDYVNRYAGGNGIEFTITPCGVAADTEGYSYDSLMNSENGLLAGKAYIKLKNGETVSCGTEYSKAYNLRDSFGGHFTFDKGHFRTGFEYPIDPDDVEYLYVGGIEYPVR